uniref:Uncharacterized protein n=1 Tax=Lactuca sativa TaxID=4236 RepID=A0A9R1UYV0_LACSA|nr:hypothetical protein LSAT_V11C700355040 [Lactuca sativa]
MGPIETILHYLHLAYVQGIHCCTQWIDNGRALFTKAIRCKKYAAEIEEVKSINYMRFVFSVRIGFTWNKKEVVMERMVGQRWMVGMVVMVDCVEVAGGEM